MITAKQFFMNCLVVNELPKNRIILDGNEFVHIMEEYGKTLLTDYTEFLLKHGYCDSDVYCEPPSAIDRYMHPKLREI